MAVNAAVEAAATRITPSVLEAVERLTTGGGSTTVEAIAESVGEHPSIVASALKRAERHGHVVLDTQTRTIRMAS